MMRRISSSCQAPSRCCRRPSRSTATPASARHNTFPDNLKAVDVQQPAVILQQGACRPDQHDNQQHEERLRISSASSATTEHQQQVEALQRVLQVPFHRAELIAHQTPTVLTFEPQTLRITIDTLCEVLHLNYHTVVAIVQKRPGILQSPDEPVMVQQQLSVLLGVTCWRMANLLGTKYADLLALTPQQLEQRCMRLCEVMHWRSEDLQTATETTGPEAFIHLLSTPASHIATQLAALAAALDCAEAPAAVAAVVQHYPRLLEWRGSLLWPQLKVLADTAGVSPRQLLCELDLQQCKGLSAILLYEPVWVQAQLRSLSVLLGLVESQAASQSHCDGSHEASAPVLRGTQVVAETGCHTGRLLVWLLCRLATPNRLAMAKVRMREVQSCAAAYQPWKDELQRADDLQLSVLLTASHEAVQQLQFLVDTGREAMCGMSLLDVVSCSQDVFRRKYGLMFDDWSDTQDK